MIELLLKAAGPELKDNSIKQYLSSLRTLNGGQPITNVDFLKDYDMVMEKLSFFSSLSASPPLKENLGSSFFDLKILMRT